MINQRNKETIKKLEDTMKDQLQGINNNILSEEIFWGRIREQERIRRSEEILINITRSRIPNKVVQDKFEQLKHKKKIQIGERLAIIVDRFGNRMVLRSDAVKDLIEGNIRISDRGYLIGFM
ncbi:MAG: hypothetical protein Ta2E_10210 [Mycoplasmoidaceae bacterium]|nr:MAG: hypothetical protein Ta2E_10210 [Mycoplasmoidaceae bacterium]